MEVVNEEGEFFLSQIALKEDATNILSEKALFGCMESAALRHNNLSETIRGLGYVKNKYEGCVFDRRTDKGVQCTVALHVADLLITSVSTHMIDELCKGLRTKYGDVSRSNRPVVN